MEDHSMHQAHLIGGQPVDEYVIARQPLPGTTVSPPAG
jgi:(2Fe-2S) ferredoxin